jgi:hypothetical protein
VSQPAQSSTASRGSWGRFGDPAARPAQAPQSNGGGGQRFSSGPASNNNSGYRSAPQSVRISPPMVRERSVPAPRPSSGGGGGSHSSGGGSHRR